MLPCGKDNLTGEKMFMKPHVAIVERGVHLTVTMAHTRQLTLCTLAKLASCPSPASRRSCDASGVTRSSKRGSSRWLCS